MHQPINKYTNKMDNLESHNSNKRLASHVFGQEENTQKITKFEDQENVISLPVEIVILISEFVPPKEFIMFTTLNKAIRKYIFNTNIQYKGMLTLNPEFDFKFDKTISFVTNLKIKPGIFIDDVLRVYPNLKSICFFGDIIRDKDAISIAEVIKNNNTLTNVDFCYRVFGYEIIYILLEALKSNKTIRTSSMSTDMFELGMAIVHAGMGIAHRSISSTHTTIGKSLVTIGKSLVISGKVHITTENPNKIITLSVMPRPVNN
jgi:hypothetical protein